MADVVGLVVSGSWPWQSPCSSAGSRPSASAVRSGVIFVVAAVLGLYGDGSVDPWNIRPLIAHWLTNEALVIDRRPATEAES